MQLDEVTISRIITKNFTDEFLEALDVTGFSGEIGIDVGGAESNIGDIDLAYDQSARWLTKHWLKHR